MPNAFVPLDAAATAARLPYPELAQAIAAMLAELRDGSAMRAGAMAVPPRSSASMAAMAWASSGYGRRAAVAAASSGMKALGIGRRMGDRWAEGNPPLSPMPRPRDQRDSIPITAAA